MDLPKLNYDDFYKFVMSASIISFIIGIIGTSYMIVYEAPFNTLEWISTGGYFSIAIAGVVYSQWSGRKWYENQKEYDKQLRADTKIKENLSKTNPEDQKKKVEREVIEENSNVTNNIDIEEEIKEKLRKKEQKIKALIDSNSNSELIESFYSIEKATLKKIQEIFPRLQQEVTISYSNSKGQGSFRLDGIITEGNKSHIFEIKIYRRKLLPSTTERIVKAFDKMLTSYRENVRVDIEGTLVIVSDFQKGGYIYKNYLTNKFENEFSKTKNKIKLILYDFTEIDF